ncbi:MAG TPA: enolase C-terminal domain-like protein, partial [Gaiellaceae bacterium]|nr:enolase C-terminal domain-like protein [Gaiellaceae bacterium]
MSSLSRSERRSSSSCPVDKVEAFARTIPTDAPESDGTFEWDSTTIVVVRVSAGDTSGLGYTYTHDAAVRLIEDKLAPAVRGTDVAARDPSSAWHEMGRLLRNIGRPGLGFMAMSAVDIALWDLRARLLDQPLVDVLGAVRDEAAVYGSGGFTSYSLERLAEQLGGWVADGIPRVKMKVGRKPEEDPARLDAVRGAIGEETELFVDANGA